MIKYIKFNTNRKQQYQIETCICEENNEIFVKKIALNEKAQIHICTIYENYKILSNIYGSKHIADCTMENKSILRIKYVKGELLSDKMALALDNNDTETFYKLLSFYKECILKGEIKNNSHFSLVEANEVNRNTNIDLTFDNIIMDNGNYIVIDYEWLYSNIPKKFVLYRAISGFIERKIRFSKLLFDMDVWKICDIKNVDLYNVKEKEFYGAVLSSYNKKYIKDIIDFHAKIVHDKETIKNMGSMINKMKNKIRACEDENNIIKESRCYKISVKYYHIRDCIFPINSRRRRFIKLIGNMMGIR